MTFLRLLSRTKLYWGLAVLFAIGVAFSPVTSKGRNIFLTSGNLSDVLRQVSITGLVAVGMTMVILIGGIDLSVGSILALGTVLAALLLTQPGFTVAAGIALPITFLVAMAGVALIVSFVSGQLGTGKSTATATAIHQGRRRSTLSAIWLPLAAGIVVAGLLTLWLASQAGSQFGMPGVLIAVSCVGLAVGALNGAIIVSGRLQPFIVTLAMMVTMLGLARLVAGQDSAVVAVYSGTNATVDIDLLRAVLWGVLPVPGLFFLAALALFMVVLKFTAFGRYVYAIGGNEEATRLSGIAVMPVKIATYAFSGMLACIAGVLYVAQYRQGKPDAGVGLELDAIAAVVIGGTSLMGGRGSLAGTLVGVLIFGLLTNILQLHNISTNVQLVMKGLIIILTVLLQERNLGQIFASLRASPQAEAQDEKTYNKLEETP
ncbi:sugar ABC transporter permease [Labrys okinawensis]|uniref:Sugar ABC transporter permease n=1 Tax=Labrys okinawensis TaxID=346911 RepID=A0A2S9QD47_9HYPH|nr:ABC transporter permease [Labrys okinawensis]PRH87266.1 sugar ABC transporter permease [Labrys okinawensis]